MTKKILVVEDDPSGARLLEYALEKEGYQVEIAVNGLEALRKTREEEPDLLILDVMLPGLDGFEVCHRLRAEPETANLPILMLSAKAQEVDRNAGERVGADLYLAKPADPVEVMAGVESLLAGKNGTGAMARTIAFLGSKGGVGTSTVAANVAVATTQANRSVLLVDLAPYCGSIPALLGLNPQHTIADLPDASDGSIDRHQLEEVLTTHSTGVRTLSSPLTVEGYKELLPPNVLSLHEALLAMGEYLLVDVPAHPSEAAMTVLGKCDSIVVVTGSGRDGLAGAGTAATLLEKAGIGQERISIVVVDRDGLLSAMEFSKISPVVESTIGVPLLAIVPHDSKASLEFESKGIPVVLAEPKRPMAISLRQVADRLMLHDQES